MHRQEVSTAILDWAAQVNTSVVSSVLKFVMYSFQYVCSFYFCSTNGVFKKMKVINAHCFKKTNTGVPAPFPTTEPANPETHLLLGEIMSLLMKLV